jgi:hypothetical protein
MQLSSSSGFALGPFSVAKNFPRASQQKPNAFLIPPE